MAKISAARVLEIAGLFFSPVGRARLRAGAWFRLWPLLFPLAALYRRSLVRRTRLIAVVGSLGKTTTTRATAAVLGRPVAEVRGWNAGGFLAGGLLQIRSGDRVALAEVGVKRRGQMHRYARLLKPDVAIVTSIATEHHKTLGPIQQIREEKAEMVRRLPPCGFAILNGDDPNVRWMAGLTRAHVVTYGFGTANDIQACDYVPEGLSGSRFRVRVEGRTHSVRTQLVGRHMVYALLAAVAAARVNGLEIGDTIRILETLAPTPHRLEPVQLADGAGLLMDDYKAVIETAESALETLAEIPARQKTVVLGEIFEPPGAPDEVYRDVGRWLAGAAQRVIFVGPPEAYARLTEGAIAEGMAPSCTQNAEGSVLTAARLLGEKLAPGDVVLVKGITTQRFERIALVLAGRDVTCERPRCRAPITWACAECPLLGRR
jgi:UDP-N-acetylmuramoyl-tripeptide--D-alanyl-D-alanine ligase